VTKGSALAICTLRCELAAAVIADSVIRLIPACFPMKPQHLPIFSGRFAGTTDLYPSGRFPGLESAGVFLSGHEANIEKWRLEKSLERTRQRRPDLLSGE
jgi:tRNA (guanine37-N1)-methyltransferase